MGGTVTTIQERVDGVAENISSTLVTVTNTINNLRDDASGTLTNIGNQCVDSLRIITHQVNHTSSMLTNAVLGLAAAIALGILLYLTNFSAILRAVVWTMFASLCLHMLLAYIRHSRHQPAPESHQQQSVQFKNERQELIIAGCENQSTIDFTGYKITDDDMNIVVCEGIKKAQCKMLRLCHGEITSKGASVLAPALTCNQTLEQLSLWNNRIGDIGVQMLSNELPFQRNQLKKLDLSDNNISDDGAKYLSHMLKTNTTMTHLTLARNRISDQGVGTLANVLQIRNRTLQALSFSGNEFITDSSIPCLMKMFESNQSLQKFWLNDCNLSESGKTKLGKIAKSKINFIQIFL
ncbi:hypothetical protein I4U23_012335 [Adineta vaga]|nr:hypothetical protein I4U23_012335 [Adineta vaga]